jgi:hypothetical protein
MTIRNSLLSEISSSQGGKYADGCLLVSIPRLLSTRLHGTTSLKTATFRLLSSLTYKSWWICCISKREKTAFGPHKPSIPGTERRKHGYLHHIKDWDIESNHLVSYFALLKRSLLERGKNMNKPTCVWKCYKLAGKMFWSKRDVWIAAWEDIT